MLRRTTLVAFAVLLGSLPAGAQFFDERRPPCDAGCRAWIRSDQAARERRVYVDDDEDDVYVYVEDRRRSSQRSEWGPAQKPGKRVAAPRRPAPAAPAVASRTRKSEPRVAKARRTAPADTPSVKIESRRAAVVAPARPVPGPAPQRAAPGPEVASAPVEAAPVRLAPPEPAPAPARIAEPKPTRDVPAVAPPPPTIADRVEAAAPAPSGGEGDASSVADEPADPPAPRTRRSEATPPPPRARVANLGEPREASAKPALTGTSSEIRQLLGLSGSTPSGATSIGEFVDASVPLKPLPAAIKALRPYYAELQYAVIGDTAVFVYPATRRVFITY